MEHSQTSKQPIEDADLRERIHDFMKKYPIGVLSTVTPSGSPNAVVIYFSVDDELLSISAHFFMFKITH